MNKTYLPNYNLEITLLGGQSFGWDFDGEWYRGFTIDRAAMIKREGEYIYWQTFPVKDDFEWLSSYLRINEKYDEIIKKIAIDQHMEKAILKYPGLRLLKQEFEETLIAFLCSPTKTIVGIRQCTRLLAQKYGEKVETDWGQVNLFPRAMSLSKATVPDLMEAKVGFRAKNILNAAKIFSETETFDQIDSLGLNIALEKLKELRGIGDKVADCIAVYGLGHNQITPFDVWGKKFATKYYGISENAKYDQLREWSINYFKGYAAWAGQFLFEYIRKEKVMS